MVDICASGVVSNFGLVFTHYPSGPLSIGAGVDHFSAPPGMFSPNSPQRTPKRKSSSHLFEEFSSKHAASLSRSPLRQLGSIGDSQVIHTSVLEEHITLAAMKARRTKIALWKRNSPLKFVLVDNDVDSSVEESQAEVHSLSSVLGLEVGPKPPQKAQ